MQHNLKCLGKRTIPLLASKLLMAKLQSPQEHKDQRKQCTLQLFCIWHPAHLQVYVTCIVVCTKKMGRAYINHAKLFLTLMFSTFFSGVFWATWKACILLYATSNASLTAGSSCRFTTEQMFQVLAEIAYILFYCTTFQHKRQVVHYTTEKKKRQLCIFTKKQSFSKKPVKSSNFLIIRLKVLQKNCQGKDLGKKRVK